MTLQETALAIRGYEAQEARDFLRAGTVAAMVVEVNRDTKKRSAPYTAETIFPHIAGILHSDKVDSGTQAPQTTPEQIEMYKALMGGEVGELPRPKESTSGD